MINSTKPLYIYTPTITEPPLATYLNRPLVSTRYLSLQGGGDVVQDETHEHVNKSGNFHVGAYFDTYSDFVTAFNHWRDEGFHPMSTFSSHKIPGSTPDSSHPYIDIAFACKHNGKHNVNKPELKVCSPKTKYNKSMVVLKQLGNHLGTCGQLEFEAKIEQLEDLLSTWEKTQNYSKFKFPSMENDISPANEQSDNIINDPSENIDTDQAINNQHLTISDDSLPDATPSHESSCSYNNLTKRDSFPNIQVTENGDLKPYLKIL